MNTLRQYTKGLLRLLYPDDCPACRGPSIPGHLFCPECAYHLRINDLHQFKNNLFTMHFNGRIPFVTGTAMFIYQKGGRIQTLIQSIKYNGSKEVARQMGQLYGEILREASLYREIEVILPVPIHPKKKKTRGFNQSAWFGRGLSKAMDIPLLLDVLKRDIAGESQTKHNRWERAENLLNAFSLADKTPLKDKHLLLVDDVLTTGATLESIARTAWEAQPASIRFCTIAMGLR